VVGNGDIGVPEDALVVRLGVPGQPYEMCRPGQPGGSITYSVFANPSSWNPVVTDEAGVINACSFFLMGMVNDYGTTGEVYGELAKSWEVSEDEKEIVFHLRRGLTWSDGAPFTADDVLFTYNDLHFNEDVNSNHRGGMRLPSGELPTIEKLDDFTIRVTTDEPFRPLLGMMGALILPKHILAPYVHKLNPEVEPGTFNTVWTADTPPELLVGMGPFTLARFDYDQQIVLERNPYYYHFDQNGCRLPYLDRIVLSIDKNVDVTILRFLSGAIDAVLLRGPDLSFMIPQEEIKGFTVYLGGVGTGASLIALNQDTADENLRWLFRQLAFRKAVAHSLDKGTLVDLVYGGQAVAVWSPTPKQSPFYMGREGYAGEHGEIGLDFPDFDLKEAARLLDECGVLDVDGDGSREFADGTPVEFTLNFSVESTSWGLSAQIYAEDLSKIGIRLVLDGLEWNTLVENLFAGQWDAVLIGLNFGNDPHSALSRAFAPDSDLHFWHYSAAEGDAYPYEQRYEELRRLGVGTYDMDRVFDYYSEFQTTYLEEDLGVIYTVAALNPFAVYDVFGNADLIAAVEGYGSREVLQLLYRTND
jgi:peptide/nickel transport system substrate-binding protein